MKKKYILAIDQGTTSSRALLFDEAMNAVAKAQREFRQIYPQPAWVEHNPTEILASVTGVISEALSLAGITLGSVAAVGITNQRETVLAWDRATGEPLCNAIVWQCRRTADYCEKLAAEGKEDYIYGKTGLKLDAYFSATKFRWILDNVAGARELAGRGQLCLGTVDSFLIWHLTGGKVFATDYTNASRTMLFNIHTLEWDEELIRLFSVPRSALPEVYPSSSDYGFVSPDLFGSKVPVTGIAGDQQAALYGQDCLTPGSAKNTYGTGCFLLMNTGCEAVSSKSGLITTLSAQCAPQRPEYALEGSVFVGGAAVQWLRDELRVIDAAADSEFYAFSVPDTGGVYMVPAFVGLGAPYWDSDARGLICGITRGTKREHIIRAALESIAFQVSDVITAMERDTGRKLTVLKADGGASANGFLMQFQSDILGCKVVLPRTPESTALGAARLAGERIGFYSSGAAGLSQGLISEIYEPKIGERKRLELIKGWKSAINKTQSK